MKTTLQRAVETFRSFISGISRRGSAADAASAQDRARLESDTVSRQSW